MAINISESTFGYLLMAFGLIMGAILFRGLTSRNRSNGITVEFAYLALPVIAIVVGAVFAFGLNDRSSRPCEPAPGETFCLPGVRPFKAPQP